MLHSDFDDPKHIYKDSVFNRNLISFRIWKNLSGTRDEIGLTWSRNRTDWISRSSQSYLVGPKWNGEIRLVLNTRSFFNKVLTFRNSKCKAATFSNRINETTWTFFLDNFLFQKWADGYANSNENLRYIF